MTKKVLTIAGSDILAGGGLQADLATFNEYGLFGLSAITSIVTVSEMDFDILAIPLENLKAQLSSIEQLTDIVAVKVGLLPSIEHIKLVAHFLDQTLKNRIIIIDPVMAFKENDDVTMNLSEIKTAYKELLLPLADVLTPNLKEAAWLLDCKISSEQDLVTAAQALQALGPKAVVVKGGKRLSGNQAIDVIVDKRKKPVILRAPKIDNLFNNGAGCTFAAAITANMALGLSNQAAIKEAKEFVLAGIRSGVSLSDTMRVGNVWQAARRMEANK